MENETTPVYKDDRYGQSRELFYFYEEGGNYEKKVGYHPDGSRIILQQAWDLFNERIEEAKQKALAGKVSPVVYYMEKTLVSPLDLSMHTGISLWRVKRHFKPRVFKRLNDKTLAKYAEVFKVSIDQLKNIE
jgi:hypothetical protein